MKKVFIAAGGTGGHINAALSMQEALKDTYDVTFVTGQRYLDYQLFENENVIHLGSKPLRTKNPLKLLANIFMNLLAFIKLKILFLKNRPSFVIGAGGYVCGPTLLAAKLLFIPIFIVEQNAVMGLTNKILAKISDLIFLNFKNTRGIKRNNKSRVVGNPIRSSITYKENIIAEELRLLVFGGSLGAEQINEAVFELVQNDFDYKLDILHQVGKGKLKQIQNLGKNVNYQQCEYINDMNEKYHWCNMILARAGASTISELRVVQRPSILIPLPIATDNHQFHNAMELKEEGKFHVEVVDNKLKGKELANALQQAINKIKNESLFQSQAMPVDNAAMLIRKEIENYVWN